VLVAFWRGGFWRETGAVRVSPWGLANSVQMARIKWCRAIDAHAEALRNSRQAVVSQIYSRDQSADHDHPALFSVKGRFWRKADADIP
jgi:hypothetical protein